jgi:hypothetical protein
MMGQEGGVWEEGSDDSGPGLNEEKKRKEGLRRKSARIYRQ